MTALLARIRNLPHSHPVGDAVALVAGAVAFWAAWIATP